MTLEILHQSGLRDLLDYGQGLNVNYLTTKRPISSAARAHSRNSTLTSDSEPEVDSRQNTGFVAVVNVCSLRNTPELSIPSLQRLCYKACCHPSAAGDRCTGPATAALTNRRCRGI